MIAGTATGILIPRLERRRTHKGRLLGLRLIHTHLRDEELSREDLTDLSKLRLDMVCALTVRENGDADKLFRAHLDVDERGASTWKAMVPVAAAASPDFVFDALVRELEGRISAGQGLRSVAEAADRAILIMVDSSGTAGREADLKEFEELAAAAGVSVAEVVVQRRPKPDPKYIVGKGKLEEIQIKALSMEANLLVFEKELSPSQSKIITAMVDMRVIDRTQLILDIFARRARTREGKIQVELAQLKYNMPRLVGGNPALSRLAGGIGTRGPGETKLEIDRRRAQERISRLEKDIADISRKRRITRIRRSRNRVPVISIVGYTNTGKSTLLNTLTRSEVMAADMPFATLDPSSKRLRFPRDLEVVVTDTVGFIRDLPADLKTAFMATLEELAEADLLLEVVDLGDPDMEARMTAVHEILKGLDLADKPRMKVFNKLDKADEDVAWNLARRYDGVAISALDRDTLGPLIEKIQDYFVKRNS